jgi:hypothetical protein
VLAEAILQRIHRFGCCKTTMTRPTASGQLLRCQLGAHRRKTVSTCCQPVCKLICIETRCFSFGCCCQVETGPSSRHRTFISPSSGVKWLEPPTISRCHGDTVINESTAAIHFLIQIGRDCCIRSSSFIAFLRFPVQRQFICWRYASGFTQFRSLVALLVHFSSFYL